MFGFNSELNVSLVDDCYWVLNEPLVYNSSQFGLIEIPKGFKTDLASIPRIPIIYELWGNRVHREAVLHDFVYRYDSSPHLSFDQANSLFLEAMESRKVKWYIKYPMYWAVCKFGSSFFCIKSMYF